jgi:hypothetical protein
MLTITRQVMNMELQEEETKTTKKITLQILNYEKITTVFFCFVDTKHTGLLRNEKKRYRMFIFILKM